MTKNYNTSFDFNFKYQTEIVPSHALRRMGEWQYSSTLLTNLVFRSVRGQLQAPASLTQG